MTTRRDFIRQAALLGAGLSMNPFFIKASSNSVGANDKIRVGLIGCKGIDSTSGWGIPTYRLSSAIRKSNVSL